MKADCLRKNSEEEITKQKLERRIGFDVLNNEYVLKDSCGGGLDLIFCDSIFRIQILAWMKRYLEENGYRRGWNGHYYGTYSGQKQAKFDVRSLTVLEVPGTHTLAVVILVHLCFTVSSTRKYRYCSITIR